MEDSSVAIIAAIIVVTAGLVKLLDFVIHRYFNKEDNENHKEICNLIHKTRNEIKDLQKVNDSTFKYTKDLFDMHNFKNPETGAYVWWVVGHKEILETLQNIDRNQTEQSKVTERIVSLVDTIERRQTHSKD